MIIDQQNSSVVMEQTVFAFDTPLSPLQDAIPGTDQGLRESEVIVGSATTTIIIAGSVDS